MRSPSESDSAAARRHGRILGEMLARNPESDAAHLAASMKLIANGNRNMAEMDERLARSERALKRSRAALAKKPRD
jgi:hypothetical protein